MEQSNTQVRPAIWIVAYLVKCLHNGCIHKVVQEG